MSEFVPEGWKRIQLNDFVLKFQNGYAFSAKGYVSDGIPIVSMGSIQLDGRFKKNNLKLKYWPETELLDLERYLVEGGDLIMAMTDVTPTMELIGRACIVESKKKYFLNQRVGLVSVDESIACKSYIAYCSNFDEWRTYCIGSSGLGAQANLGTAQILGGYLTLPPLPEQQKIAAILTSVDEVIEKTQAQINKLKDLKTGMMQELLTRGVGVDGKPHTDFKDSPVGRIPKAWEVLELDQVTKVIDCKHATPKYFPTGFPVIKPGNIKEGYLDIGGCALTDRAGFDNLNENHTPSVGDIIYSRNQTYGIGAYVNKFMEFCIGQDVCVIHPIKCEPLFLYYMINSPVVKEQVELLAAGSTFKRINLGSIRKLKIVLPNRAEQEVIASVFESFDNKIMLLEMKLDKHKSIKKALMQDLLTGKVRVKVDS